MYTLTLQDKPYTYSYLSKQLCQVAIFKAMLKHADAADLCADFVQPAIPNTPENADLRMMLGMLVLADIDARLENLKNSPVGSSPGPVQPLEAKPLSCPPTHA